MAPFPEMPRDDSQLDLSESARDAGAGSTTILTEAAGATAVTLPEDLMRLLAQNCSALLARAVISATTTSAVEEEEVMSSAEPAGQYYLDEFQIVKAVVLATVTCIILVSICKMVFQLFVQYALKSDDR